MAPADGLMRMRVGSVWPPAPGLLRGAASSKRKLRVSCPPRGTSGLVAGHAA